MVFDGKIRSSSADPEQVLQLQSALHAPATTAAAKNSKTTTEGQGTATDPEAVARPTTTNTSATTTPGLKGDQSCRVATTAAAEEELMLSEHYGPESSHLNELMKKVRIRFCFSFYGPPRPSLARWCVFCGLPIHLLKLLPVLFD